MSDPIIDHLRRELAYLHVPAGMRSFQGVPPMQFAFFPGASGLWLGDDAGFPVGGTLVLGSNFGSVQSHIDRHGKLLRNDERHGRTWAPLVVALREAGVPPEQCFFTNAWPLLHHAKGNCSGQIHRWLRDEKLMKTAVRFFHQTLEIMRPRMIVSLGVGPAAFCGRVWPEELGPWAKAKWLAIDQVPFAKVRSGPTTSVCVAITHTCRPNWKHRPRFRTRSLEFALLSSAWMQAEATGVHGDSPERRGQMAELLSSPRCGMAV